MKDNYTHEREFLVRLSDALFYASAFDLAPVPVLIMDKLFSHTRIYFLYVLQAKSSNLICRCCKFIVRQICQQAHVDISAKNQLHTNWSKGGREVVTKLEQRNEKLNYYKTEGLLNLEIDKVRCYHLNFRDRRTSLRIDTRKLLIARTSFLFLTPQLFQKLAECTKPRFVFY